MDRARTSKLQSVPPPGFIQRNKLCRLQAACFLPLAVRYSLISFFCSLSFTGRSLLVVCFFLLASWLYFFVSRSPFSARYTLLSICCSLFPNSLIAPHSLLLGLHLSSPTERCTQLSNFFSILVSCYAFLATHFPQSVAAGCPLFSLNCSILANHNQLVACKIQSLIARSSLSDVCCPLSANRFLLLDSCFLLLGCDRQLADRHSLHNAFNSLLTALCLMLSIRSARLIFAFR